MSKAEELANELERHKRKIAGPSGDTPAIMAQSAAELRRLAQVERELEAINASIGEPVAVAGDAPGTRGGFTMAVFSGLTVPRGTKLYAIKEVK